jgi:hypothetical protein
MATVARAFFRPDKGNHAETVLYEIDLLRFARDRLLSPPSSWTKGDEWVYLEDFLLHYRNLIEFFGNFHPHKTDLTIKRPNNFWPSKLPERKALDSMANPKLWEKYDTYNNLEAISKYLHHCTEQRVIKKKWYVEQMYEELRPAIELFASLLPEYKPATSLTTPRNVRVSFLDGNSTASTRTSASPLIPEK